MENEQMSTPLPQRALKMPPMKPVTRRTAAFQKQKSGIVSKVFRLNCLDGKNNIF